MQLPDFLVDHPDGEIRFVGHRIGLYHVLDHYQEGYSPDMLHEEYPTLSLVLINKAIAFYLEHREPIDAYLAGYRVELEQAEAACPPSPVVLRIRRQMEEKERRKKMTPPQVS